MDQTAGAAVHFLRDPPEAMAPSAEGQGLAVAEAARGLAGQLAEGEARGPVAVEIGLVHAEILAPAL